ncbi:MAG: DUF501 domain-containing protein [Sandaracinaceae bacterium]|nr:DUF501 domain-containing protein [Sandaracinaceae bacterium]
MDSSEEEIRALEVQLGRPIQGESRIARRCHLSLPVVVEVEPLTSDERPFPTLYWLSCPVLRRRVSRVEERGAVRELDERVASDPDFRARFEDAASAYAKRRDAKLPEGAALTPRGGIGGSMGGVKCLHAHLAEYLISGLSPAGEWVSREVLPVSCEMPCVIREGEELKKNPEFREPRQ